MSRMVVFNLNGTSAGELHTNCNRGWAINEGGQASVTLSAEQAGQGWLEFGRIALIEHARLPGWAGVIDTPWKASPPVGMTLYNAGYLLKLRIAENAVSLRGSAGAIAEQLLALASAGEDLSMRMGEVDTSGAERVEVFEQRPVWDLLVDLAKRSGMEMQIRPERDAAGRIVLYLDFKERLGMESGFLLHDGRNANMQVADAQIDGELWNSIMGIGDQASKSSRLQAGPARDEESIARYRLRSTVMQFAGVTAQSTLLENVSQALKAQARPRLILTVNALDVGGTFEALQLGNSVQVQAANVLLPGGTRGWRGRARIMAMAYDEGRNSVSMTMEAAL